MAETVDTVKFYIAPNLLERDFAADAPQPEVGWRHHLYLDA